MNKIGLYMLVRREVERTFRVITQTLVTPWISAVLYIFIFGSVVGKRIDLIAGVSYIDFVLPGILMMNVIASAFGASSSSLYFKRFIRDIEEMLVAPLSHLEMILGFVISAVIRSVIIAVGIFFIALFFTNETSIAHFGLFVFYTMAVSAIFALLGLLVGLWSNGFEQLNILTTFVITPFTFLGGVFYSIEMLPEKLQLIAVWNPFFYFVDGIRYSMIGISEANTAIGLTLIIGLVLGLTGLVTYLFKIGWRIRE
jgi:ABC-2 type transport system permease protein